MLNGPIEIDSVPVDDRGANEAQALDVVEPIRLYWVMGRSGFGYFTPPILALDAMGGCPPHSFRCRVIALRTTPASRRHGLR